MKITRQAPNQREFLPSLASAMRGGRYWRSILKFEPRDLWIGVYWDAKDIEYEYAKDFVRSTYRWYVNVFVCPLPTLVVRFAIEFGNPKWKRGDMTNFNRGRDETNRHIVTNAPLNMPEDRTAMIEKSIAADEPNP